MIRWSYVVPRLLAIAVCLLAVRFGLPAAVQWTVTRIVRSTTGAELAIDETRLSLGRGQLRLSGVKLARSAEADHNLGQVDVANLSINLRALTHRQLTVDAAELRGIQLDTARVPNPQTEEPKEERAPNGGESMIAERSRQAARLVFDRLSTNFQRRVEDEFTSVRLSQDLAKRWPSDYRQLRDRVIACRESADRVKQILQTPPRLTMSTEQISTIQQHWQEAEQLKQDVVQLRADLERMTAQLARDRSDVQQALAHDRSVLQQKMRLSSLDGQALNDYFLDQEFQRWWKRLQPWLHAAQWMTRKPPPNMATGRGKTIAFGKLPTSPSLLIRSARLDGQLTIDGQDVPFLGVARDLCLPLAAAPRPTRLHLESRSPWSARLDMEIDHLGRVPRHRLALRCSGVNVPDRQWGQPDRLQVRVGSGTANLQLLLTTTDHTLSGRLIVEQAQLELQARFGGDSQLAELQQSLADAIQGAHDVHLAIDVSGPIRSPQWNLRSDLGDQLRKPLSRALYQALDRQTERLTLKADQKVQETLGDLQESWLNAKANLTQQLGISDQILSTLANPVASRIPSLGRFLRK